jgi:hypothetical protein
VVKVLDFGIALLPEYGHVSGRLTEAGTAIGTPAYMSPEQLEGRHVDFRSDLFSFGVVLYELATGRNPFAAATAIATAGRVLAVDPPALSFASPSLPRALDGIVRRCLEKDPAKRCSSAEDLAAELEALAATVKPDRVPAPEGKTDAGLLPRGWWVLHQCGVMAVYAALVYAVWQVKRHGGGVWTLTCLLTMVAAVAFNGTLRVHLLFTAHFNRSGMAGELRRARPSMLTSDLVVSVVLLAAAAAVAQTWTALAVTLAAFGIGVAAAALVVEPATTRAVFGGATGRHDRMS